MRRDHESFARTLHLFTAHNHTRLCRAIFDQKNPVVFASGVVLTPSSLLPRLSLLRSIEDRSRHFYVAAERPPCVTERAKLCSVSYDVPLEMWHMEQQLEILYRAVVNHEEQYSIWPLDRDLPLGWRDTGRSGTKQECLDYIQEVWTDMRPLSLRKRMEAAGLS